MEYKFDGKSIGDYNNYRVATFDGKIIRDYNKSQIGTIDDVRKQIDGIGGITLVGLWVLLVQ